MNKTLIHSALLCECQPLINYYKLKQDKSVQSFKLFYNEKIIVAVSGIGKENTLSTLDYVFKNFQIDKAINIGTAGCKDKKIKIGTLFCTNKNLENIAYTSLSTLDIPINNPCKIKTTLVDMEAIYFEEVCKKFIDNILILKVVSDYLDIKIPKKSYIIELMQNSFKQWKDLI